LPSEPWQLKSGKTRELGLSSLASGGSGGGSISSSSTLANKLQNRVEDGVTSGGSASTGIATGLTTSTGTGIAAGSSVRDEDGPFTVQVSNREGQLVLLNLELKLANSLVNDEGLGGGIEFADLALADVKSVWKIVSVRDGDLEREGIWEETYCRQ
jgi:hypothetical protein